MDKNKDKNNKQYLTFSAINQVWEDNIISPVEKEIRGQNYIQYGDNNIYPLYIQDLTENCSLLQALIESTCDYVVGDSVTSHIAQLSDKEALELVKEIAHDLIVFGGCAIEVQRNHLGRPCKFNVLNFCNVRSNEDNSVYYYSKDFSNGKSYGRVKAKVYSAFNPKNTVKESQILYIKNKKHRTYPLPTWSSACLDAEILKHVKDYNINALQNNFSPNVMLSFLNGVPDDNTKDEIERAVTEKFSGYQNTGRFILNFAPDEEHSLKVDTIQTEDLTERFKTLVSRSESNLYTAFRTSELLLGRARENIGFNAQEYSEQFKLYAKTVVKPIQTRIVDIIDMLTGIESSIEIQPFSINFNDEDNEQTEEVID